MFIFPGHNTSNDWTVEGQGIPSYGVRSSKETVWGGMFFFACLGSKKPIFIYCRFKLGVKDVHVSIFRVFFS